MENYWFRLPHHTNEKFGIMQKLKKTKSALENIDWPTIFAGLDVDAVIHIQMHQYIVVIHS